MADDPILPSLKIQSQDYAASAAKAVLGTVPFAGSLLAEVAGTIIPNQRVDRVVKFAQVLEAKLVTLDKDFIRMKLTDENFTDLLEESIRQAARSLSDERRQYLASMIASGLSAETIELFESKHLLRILGEINDIEVIHLRFYWDTTMDADDEFREKHRDVLWCEPATTDLPPHVLRHVADKETLHRSYREHLASLGLLSPRYKMDSYRKNVQLDTRTGTPTVQSYEITSLGRLLLRHIGLVGEAEDE